MSDNGVAAEQEQEPAGQEPESSAGEGPAPARPRHPEPFIPPGPVSTKELRERARRRREAEEKLQQHLLKAKEKPSGE